MAVTYHWYNQQKDVVKFKFTAPWTISELAECETLLRAEINTLSHVVDAIFDVSGASVLPQNALSYFMSSLRKGESIDNEGATVVLGANLFIQAIGNAITKTMQNSAIYFAVDAGEVDDILATIKLKRDIVA